MSEQVFRQLMIGLPGTGKTTFLAALWHVIRSDEVPGTLRLKVAHGNREYLNRIADQWCSCAELARTPAGAWETTSIRVTDPETGTEAELMVPDISGETYARHWEARECTPEYVEIASGASGVMLFLHPDRTFETDSILKANDVHAAWGEANEAEVEGETESPSPDITWSPARTPTQVQMVELIQFLETHVQAPLKIAVIISAWDLVEDGLAPEEWLETRMPLLHQLLTANRENFAWHCYGVSAQGGELNRAERLLEAESPSRRIRIRGQECSPHDITAPVKWLMRSDEG